MSSALCCKSRPSSSSGPIGARGVSPPLSNGVLRTHLPLPIKVSNPSSMSSGEQAALEALFGHTKNAVDGENIELSKATFRQRALSRPGPTSPSPSKFSVIKSRLKRQLSQRSSTLRGTSSEEQPSSKPGIADHSGPQSTTEKQPYDADSWAYRTPEAGGYDRDAIVLRLSRDFDELFPQAVSQGGQRSSGIVSNSPAKREHPEAIDVETRLSFNDIDNQDAANDASSQSPHSGDSRQTPALPFSDVESLEIPEDEPSKSLDSRNDQGTPIISVCSLLLYEHPPVGRHAEEESTAKPLPDGRSLAKGQEPLDQLEAESPNVPPAPSLQPQRIPSITDSLIQNTYQLSVSSQRKVSLALVSSSIEPGIRETSEEDSAPADSDVGSAGTRMPSDRILGPDASSVKASGSNPNMPAAMIATRDQSPFDGPRRVSSLPAIHTFIARPIPYHSPASLLGLDRSSPHRSYINHGSGYDGSEEWPMADTSSEPGGRPELRLDTGVGMESLLAVRNTSRRSSVSETGDPHASVATGTRLRLAGRSVPPASWSRYPSHTRHHRNGSAGIKDDVRVRDFAMTSRDGDDALALTGTTATIWPDRSLQVEQRIVPNLLHPRGTTIGKSILDRIGRLYRTHSTDYRLPNSGHRSSVATGGSLEHPELEILPPRSPAAALLWRRQDRASADDVELLDLAAVPRVEFSPSVNTSTDDATTFIPIIMDANGQTRPTSSSSLRTGSVAKADKYLSPPLPQLKIKRN